MRIRVLVGIILVIALLAGTSCFGSSNKASSFSGQFAAIVQPYRFNLSKWEFSTFLSSLKTQTFNPGPQSALSAQNVMDYFSTMSQESALRSEMQLASTKNPESDMSASQSRMNALEDRQAALAPIVEQTLADQISQTLASLGIYNPISDRLKLTFPPVNFKLEKPLYVLVVSDRNKIDRLESITIEPDITAAQIDQLESSVDQLNVSSLVVAIGGMAVTYPTFVINSSDMRWTIDTAVHEWTHQYLAFEPLGARYILDLLGIAPNPPLVTLNETVANIVGDEVGGLVYQKYYAQYDTGNIDSGEAGTPSSENILNTFDFNKTMRETRINVDNYLAKGQINQAETYMESQRQLLVSHGYYIRKLNQAYFSFYGSYADSPTSVDPTGAKLQQLRAQSPSIKDFLDTVSHFQSPEDLNKALSPALRP